MINKFRLGSFPKFDDAIVIVGGGAGGLELATKLGRHYKNSTQKVILIDQNRSHVWKPLLHEVAAGALDADIDGVDYLSHGAKNGFLFQLGRVNGLDRDKKQVLISELLDENNLEILPARQVNYGILVFALGSVTNDFGTKGVKEHCIFLDTCKNAENFHTRLLNEFLKLQGNDDGSKLNIAIVGAGATGVELAAELFKTSEQLKSYGYNYLSQARLNISLIEAGPRILGALPERIAKSVQRQLEALGVTVCVNTAVTEVNEKSLTMKDGSTIDAAISVWAAGIKAPNFLQGIAGLETARNNQLVVLTTLQTSLDENIFAIGDCASCVTEAGIKVPPRAQAAHQMSDHVFKNIIAKSKGKPLTPYVYVDYGSLVSLSSYSTVGSLMGNFTRGSMFIEGHVARIVYVMLYRMHQVALYGVLKTGLIMLIGRLNRALRPNLKLH